jgi:hypothetical protein
MHLAGSSQMHAEAISGSTVLPGTNDEQVPTAVIDVSDNSEGWEANRKDEDAGSASARSSTSIKLRKRKTNQIETNLSHVVRAVPGEPAEPEGVEAPPPL